MQAIKLPQVTLLEFSEWLKEIGRAASLFYNPTVKPERFHSRKSETVSTFDDKKGLSKSRKCVVCSETQNQLENCSLFKNMTVVDRWKIVTRNK